MVRSGLSIFAALVLCAVAPHAAWAQSSVADVVRCQDFGLDDGDVSARIHDIRARIAHHEPDMRHWVTAVGVLHGALIGAELVLTFTASGDGPRNEGIIGTLSSTLGLVTLLASFPPLVGAGGTLDGMPEDTPEQRVAKLVRAEQLLRVSAEGVAFVRGPVASLLSAGYVGVVAGVLLALPLIPSLQLSPRPTGAYVLAAGGVVLGQGRILVHPDGILHEWRRYRALHPDAGCAAPVAAPTASVRWEIGPAALPAGGGLGLSLTF